MKKERMFPMNLQFFAESEPSETKPDETKPEPQPKVEQDATASPEKHEEEKKNEPNVQELMVELARVKRQLDKTSSEASEYKKKWKESLSEQEQASMEKAEAQAKKDEEFESLKRQVRVNELTENFMDLGYSKDLARKAANAQADGDTQTLLDIQKAFQEQQKKSWEQEFLKNRPEIATGNGTTTTISKEQFDKMTLVEKSKLKRENEAEYNRLLAL